MEIIRINKIGEIYVPVIKIIPSEYEGIVLIIHGYGGCKEEMLGLGYRIAETGFLTYTVDLRGHGENEIQYDENVVTDINQIAEIIKEPGKKVITIGHSLGGRLAFISNCDYSIGISPALNKEFGIQTQEIINNIRSYRVKEKYPGINFDILKNIPGYSVKKENAKIIYGSRDIPEIVKRCNIMRELGYDVVMMEQALHNDIYLNNKVIEIIIRTLKGWLS